MGFPLPEQEIEKALSHLEYWHRKGDAIEREYHFDDFMNSIRFVNRLAELAEELNHHPDITINFNRVKVSLTTHDAGGVTDRDLKLANRINQLHM